ncbi:5771_t:CDS:2, partial [Funneliformis geosporum]
MTFDNNEEYEEEELIAQRHYVVFGDQDDLTLLAKSNPKQISLEHTTIENHHIPVENPMPIRQRTYRVAPLEQEFIKEE